MESFVAINKPVGPTSHDIVDRIRKITGVKKVGHAGTLDPLASGVLVVGIGRDATKQLGSIVAKEKEYIATVQLDQTSTTDDGEGEKTLVGVNAEVTQDDIEKILGQFIGDIDQIPPAYSAIKMQGKPAYKRVRRGEKIEMKPRKVAIKNIQIDKYAWPELVIKVATGPGVYVRSLARDIGEVLGCGGFLSGLERIRVGEYTIENAVSIEDFEKERAS